MCDKSDFVNCDRSCFVLCAINGICALLKFACDNVYLCAIKVNFVVQIE